MQKYIEDTEIIKYYGGSTKLARLLGFTTQNDIVKISQWKYRGIPARWKLKHPEIFLKDEFKI
jgi:hypothetical protein